MRMATSCTMAQCYHPDMKSRQSMSGQPFSMVVAEIEKSYKQWLVEKSVIINVSNELENNERLEDLSRGQVEKCCSAYVDRIKKKFDTWKFHNGTRRLW